MKTLGALSLLVINAVLATALKAFVLCKYWSWFVLSTGLTTFNLSFYQAAALTLTFSLLTAKTISKTDLKLNETKKDEDFSDSIVFNFFSIIGTYATLLGMAYLIKLILF